MGEVAPHLAVPPRPPSGPARQALQTEDARLPQNAAAKKATAARDPVADQEPPIIEVPNSFRARKGTRVVDGWQIGEALGTGLQGGVYFLVDDNGNKDPKHVLKAKHRYALLVKVRREWEVGRRVNSLLNPERAMPGYMGTGRGVVMANGHFQGMLLERLDGRSPAKVVGAKDFHDIGYLRDLLFNIFTALDVGQRRMGFHHADLRIDNVMEVTGVKGLNRFRIIDFGLADFCELYAAGRVGTSAGGGTGAKAVKSEESRSPSGKRLRGSERRARKDQPVPDCMANLREIPKVSLLERSYRFFWRHKGDVYHVLWDLCRYLDGKVWLEKDEFAVRLLLSLIHHVTGVRLKAFFAASPEPDNGELRPDQRAVCGLFEKHDGFLHCVRIRGIRLRAWFNPTNCGLTSGEALQAPFFKLTSEGASINTLGRRVESKGPAPSPGSLDPAASVASIAFPGLDSAQSMASNQGLPAPPSA
ncbi:hypothetical protein WJX81_001420 [Elliptochloris bilobata]|uniref:Protein kinase domain-containing protein n=1 Tax=Elliptochloris bilobata TaxID=381761 RepID=A0AAW1SAW9_9CHLO